MRKAIPGVCTGRLDFVSPLRFNHWLDKLNIQKRGVSLTVAAGPRDSEYVEPNED